MICSTYTTVLLSFITDNTFPNIRDTASRIIKNISYHPDNRTPLYATELLIRSREMIADIGATVLPAPAATVLGGVISGTTTQRTEWTAITGTTRLTSGAPNPLANKLRTLTSRMSAPFAGALGPPGSIHGDERRKALPVQLPSVVPPPRQSRAPQASPVITSTAQLFSSADFAPTTPSKASGLIHPLSEAVATLTVGSPIMAPEEDREEGT